MSPAVIAVIPLVVVVPVIAAVVWNLSWKLGKDDRWGLVFLVVLGLPFLMFATWYLGNVIWFDTWATWTVVEV